MTEAWLGLGSNVGGRTEFVRNAVSGLKGDDRITVTGVSSLYETSPVGGPPQRSFINAVLRIETSLSPQELLEVTQQVEHKLGREESAIRWGPRVIDIDILLFGDEKISEPNLEIPHPRIAERRFVLVPLLEVDPTVADPWGTRYSTFLEELEGDVTLQEPF